MYRPTNAPLLLTSLLIVSSILHSPCSAFLYEKINFELNEEPAAKSPDKIEIQTTISGGGLVIGSEITVKAELE